MNHSVQIESLLSSATMLNAVICAGITICASVFVAKLIKETVVEVSILGIQLNLNRAWIVISIFTIIHLFASFYISRACERIMRNDFTRQERINAWEKLTQTDMTRLIFSQMEERKLVTGSLLGRKVTYYRIEQEDLAGILSIAFTSLVFLSLTNFRYETNQKLISNTSIALFLCIANWLIGSWWAIKCSQLLSSN